MTTKKVYIALDADIIHPGNINIINSASKYGEVTVGLSTDELMAKTSRLPFMNWEQRKEVLESIKGISNIIEQKSIDGHEEILKIKPDYVVHGNKWRSIRIKNIINDELKTYGGELIEIEFTKSFSADELHDSYKDIGTTPDRRRSTLKKLINYKGFLTAIEAHNGLTGLIVEKTKIEKEGITKEFDAMWLSSLTDSTAKGKPDIEVVDVTSRMNTIQDILESTTKPIIYDGDTGGKTEHFVYTVKTLERLGISAVIIEDKVGLKKNSLFGTGALQKQDTIEGFCDKIIAGKQAQVSDDFMIFARIESLILKQGMDDALNRAKAYIEKGGVDGIMIHSKEKEPDEILEFCEKFKKFGKDIPLVVVPTSYNKITEDELKKAGINVCIYANHLLRAAYPAMKDVAEKILLNERSYEVDNECLSIKEILHLIPGGS